jgi:hypothetical protein
MNELIKPLGDAEAINTSDDVGALLQAQQTCQSIINLEPDPLNTFRKRAQVAESQISANLSQAAQSDASKAANALQSGNEKDAVRLYNLAAKANPGDQDIAAQRNKLLDKVGGECKKLYEQGIVQLDLQQNDQARQDFQHVVDLSAPGEKYYDLAQAKLKDLAQ